MTARPRANKRDKNEPEIVDALEQVGAQVWQLDKPVDLAVLYRDDWYMLEVKMPKGKLTPSQVKFFADVGDTPNVGIVRSVYDALELIGAIEGDSEANNEGNE